MTLVATLVADSGAASVEPEFFRSETFLRIECTTHSLIIETPRGRLALPVVVRAIPGSTAVDATSPYGYPGGSLTGPAPELSEIDFSGLGLVSLFVRDRIASSAISGGTARSRVLLHDPAHPRRVRARIATKARSNERAGYRVELIPGQEVDTIMTRDFTAIYIETMRRAGAAGRYFFSEAYIGGCLRFDRSWLAITRAPDRGLAAAAIGAVSDGMLHYFLGGSADGHRHAAPAKNCMLRLLDLADDLGLPLNLGGGMSPGDGLEAYKAGFANAERTFVTHDVICDSDAYAALSDGYQQAEFFPTYRAPLNQATARES